MNLHPFNIALRLRMGRVTRMRACAVYHKDAQLMLYTTSHSTTQQHTHTHMRARATSMHTRSTQTDWAEAACKSQP